MCLALPRQAWNRGHQDWSLPCPSPLPDKSLLEGVGVEEHSKPQAWGSRL